MGDATQAEERGNWTTFPSSYHLPAWVMCSQSSADDERVYVYSRQDCDDLIELLRVVRERLP